MDKKPLFAEAVCELPDDDCPSGRGSGVEMTFGNTDPDFGRRIPDSYVKTLKQVGNRIRVEPW